MDPDAKIPDLPNLNLTALWSHPISVNLPQPCKRGGVGIKDQSFLSVKAAALSKAVQARESLFKSWLLNNLCPADSSRTVVPGLALQKTNTEHHRPRHVNDIFFLNFIGPLLAASNKRVFQKSGFDRKPPL